jgi:hypothetical protein
MRFEVLVDPGLNRRRHPLDEFYATITVGHDDKAGFPRRAAFTEAMRTGVVTTMADEEAVASRDNAPAERPFGLVVVCGLNWESSAERGVITSSRNFAWSLAVVRRPPADA